VGTLFISLSPVHDPGFRVNALGVMAETPAAGESDIVIPVTCTVPLLQTWAENGT
jgi:hypothetical protein